MTLEIPDLSRPAAGLRGVMENLAAGICDDIACLDTDRAERVHDIRVATKKLRALLRLARADRADERFAAVEALLKSLRGRFSGTRDHDVMRQRLGELAPDRAEVVEELGLHEGPGEEPDREAARAEAETLRAALAALDLGSVRRKTLVRNAGDALRRAKRLRKRCARTPEDTTLMHKWRKRVKDVFYHAQAFAKVPGWGRLAARLDPLAERLGEFHDLAVLRAHAGNHPVSGLVAPRAAVVADECFRLAEKIFSPKTSSREESLRRALRP
jgi:CHAD domain-containing protein